MERKGNVRETEERQKERTNEVSVMLVPGVRLSCAMLERRWEWWLQSLLQWLFQRLQGTLSGCECWSDEATSQCDPGACASNFFAFTMNTRSGKAQPWEST